MDAVTSSAVVRAAGCVVWRPGEDEPEVLLVHRPRRLDWSFPKGKLDPGETEIAAATREVHEETGLRVRLGLRLPDQHYEVAGAPKVVNYWTAQPASDADPAAFESNDEVDELRWTALSTARQILTYPRDVGLLDAFGSVAHDSTPLLIVRHAEAVKRAAWDGVENRRPLKREGQRQAAKLVPLLLAYGVSRVVSSDATRCLETVRPYVEASGAALRLDPAFAEETAEPGLLKERVAELLQRGEPAALCTHRPLLSAVFEAAGTDLVGLMPAETVVLHHSAGRVVDCEQHAV